MSQPTNPFAERPAENLNPYASPSVPVFPGEGNNYVFRQGDLLVMHKQAGLPPFCVKTNQPAEQFLTKTFYWHSPWLFLLILVNILVFAIVAMIVRKSIKVTYGLTTERLRSLRMRQAIAAVSIVLSIGCIILGCILGDSARGQGGEALMILIPLGFLALLGSLLFLALATKTITPKKIDDQWAWFSGVHPDYLARLPQWPGP